MCTLNTISVNNSILLVEENLVSEIYYVRNCTKYINDITCSPISIPLSFFLNDYTYNICRSQDKCLNFPQIGLKLLTTFCGKHIGQVDK